jgi:hypothetical protein
LRDRFGDRAVVIFDEVSPPKHDLGLGRQPRDGPGRGHRRPDRAGSTHAVL